MAIYYKVDKKKYKYDEIKEFNQTEKERGLDKCCECGDKKWLLLPKEKHQKQYVMCLRCSWFSHL